MVDISKITRVPQHVYIYMYVCDLGAAKVQETSAFLRS